MTADEVAAYVTALLERELAESHPGASAVVRRHHVNGRLVPAVVLELRTGEVLRFTVDLIGEEPSS